jgi:hypothetical protein
MIETELLKKSIRPGTSESLVNHILFTNAHHYGGKTHDEVVAKFKAHLIGEDIDFDMLEKLRQEVATLRADAPRVVAREVSVQDALRSLCGDALLNHLRRLGD